MGENMQTRDGAARQSLAETGSQAEPGNQEAIRLRFDGGTVVVAGGAPEELATLPGSRFDPRSNSYRAEGRAYRAIVEHRLVQQLEHHRWRRPIGSPLSQQRRQRCPHDAVRMDESATEDKKWIKKKIQEHSSKHNQ